MNKKAVSMAFEKVIILIISIAVLIVVFIFAKGSIENLIKSFIDFIKQIFKY